MGKIHFQKGKRGKPLMDASGPALVLSIRLPPRHRRALGKKPRQAVMELIERYLLAGAPIAH